MGLLPAARAPGGERRPLLPSTSRGGGTASTAHRTSSSRKTAAVAILVCAVLVAVQLLSPAHPDGRGPAATDLITFEKAATASTPAPEPAASSDTEAEDVEAGTLPEHVKIQLRTRVYEVSDAKPDATATADGAHTPTFPARSKAEDEELGESNGEQLLSEIGADAASGDGCSGVEMMNTATDFEILVDAACFQVRGAVHISSALDLCRQLVGPLLKPTAFAEGRLR
eukprot:SAG31_NODE_2315_length_5951_cov_9.080472_1_plen_227_part_00